MWRGGEELGGILVSGAIEDEDIWLQRNLLSLSEDKPKIAEESKPRFNEDR